MRLTIRSFLSRDSSESFAIVKETSTSWSFINWTRIRRGEKSGDFSGVVLSLPVTGVLRFSNLSVGIKAPPVEQSPSDRIYVCGFRDWGAFSYGSLGPRRLLFFHTKTALNDPGNTIAGK